MTGISADGLGSAAGKRVQVGMWNMSNCCCGSSSGSLNRPQRLGAGCDVLGIGMAHLVILSPDQNPAPCILAQFGGAIILVEYNPFLPASFRRQNPSNGRCFLALVLS